MRDEADEIDLTIGDLIALFKAYGISITASAEIVAERMVELWPEIQPAPTHDAPQALQ